MPLVLALFGLLIVAIAVAVTMALHAGARRMARVEQTVQLGAAPRAPPPPYEALFTPIDELLQRPSRPSLDPSPLDVVEDEIPRA